VRCSKYEYAEGGRFVSSTATTRTIRCCLWSTSPSNGGVVGVCRHFRHQIKSNPGCGSEQPSYSFETRLQYLLTLHSRPQIGIIKLENRYVHHGRVQNHAGYGVESHSIKATTARKPLPPRFTYSV